ncbi:PAS domain S-box protein [Phormidium pseudopriestleyi FRX01]|uniref:histidine kinase n=1 Tax=Phormidium pseudopriestleyi FRX01 TaxID=1759528 RepID=A0ABS3FRA6_9CYAN|nr:PAS domain S-box protein [Phormidium pseudopriestleyi]MBO0349524.1 PAS domain S-box protein [Phormidium pseudopriestleyi FRX01]
MKLQTKLVSSFLGLTAVVAVLGITHVNSNQTISQRIEEISIHKVPKIVALEEIKVTLVRMITEVTSYALLQSELEGLGEKRNNASSFVEGKSGEYQEAHQTLERALAQLDRLTPSTGEEREFLEDLKQIIEEIDRIAKEIIELKSQNINSPILTNYRNLEEIKIVFTSKINSQAEKAVFDLKEDQKLLAKQTYQAKFVNLILIVLIALLAISLGLLLAEDIAKPIIQLKNAAIAIGQGKLNVRVNINNSSEIGVLANAFNSMAEELNKKTVSKHYVDNIFKSLLDALIILNPDGTIRDFNFATLFLLGYENDTELLGRSISTLLKDRLTYDELATQTGITNSLIGRKEVEFLSKDGQIIPVYFSASVMREEAGEIQAIVCLAQDIRERKRAEAALQESEYRYHTLASISPVGIFRMSGTGQFLYLNERLSQITGLTESQAKIGDWFEVIHPGDRDRVIQEWNQSVKEQLPFQSEFRFLHENGTERWVWGQAVCQSDKDCNRSDYVGTIADITERKRMEEALQKANDELETRVQNRTFELRQALEQLQRESLERKLVAEALHQSQERLNGILHSIDDVVWSISGTTSEMLYLSPAVETIYERPFSAFFENFNLWQDVIYPNDRAVVNLAFQTSLETGSTDLEYRIVRPSGEVRWLRQRTRLVRDFDGNPLRIDGIASDITDRKQAEAKLRKSELRYRKLAKQEALINRLTDQIRNSLEIDTILETAVSEIRSLLQVDRCLFIWYRPQGLGKPNDSHNGATPTLSPCWEVVKESHTPDLTSLLGYYPTDPQSCLMTQLLNRETIRVDDVSQTQNSDYQNLQTAWGYQAFVALPIQTLNGEIGLVSCGHCQGPRRWSDRELLLLKAIANQVAIAISQAELYIRATDSARHAREKAQQLQQTLRELQKTQTQLIQTEKMSSLGQMVAGVAHEINNPVSFIYGNIEPANEYIQNLLDLLELYQTHYAEPVPEIQEFIEEIELDFIIDDLPKLLSSMKVGANRIREIVLSLRNFSRLDESQMKSVNLHEGIDSTLLILQNRLKAKPGRGEIKIIKEYDTLPLVECYGGELNQVFMNLLSNAIDALERPLKNNKSKQHTALLPDATQTKSDAAISTKNYAPYIRIQTTHPGINQIEIRISDNGTGMTEEVKQRIFDPFFTTKPVGAGTGLGLSISYQIVVEKHRGKLECFSIPGKGTEFLISLPIHPE